MLPSSPTVSHSSSELSLAGGCGWGLASSAGTSISISSGPLERLREFVLSAAKTDDVAVPQYVIIRTYSVPSMDRPHQHCNVIWTVLMLSSTDADHGPMHACGQEMLTNVALSMQQRICEEGTCFKSCLGLCIFFSLQDVLPASIPGNAAGGYAITTCCCIHSILHLLHLSPATHTA